MILSVVLGCNTGHYRLSKLAIRPFYETFDVHRDAAQVIGLASKLQPQHSNLLLGPVGDQSLQGWANSEAHPLGKGKFFLLRRWRQGHQQGSSKDVGRECHLEEHNYPCLKW